MNALQQFLQAASNEAAGTISGPVDLIGMGLRKLGVPVPRNALMSSEWMRQNGLMQDVPQSGASLAGQTFGLLSPVVAAAKAPQIARGLLTMGDNAAAPRRLNPQTGAIVYHGSPHKFDAFDSSKIGSGEGAQAYGHGLYLAEAPAVAKEYTYAGLTNRYGDPTDSYMSHVKNLVPETRKQLAELVANKPWGKAYLNRMSDDALEAALIDAQRNIIIGDAANSSDELSQAAAKVSSQNALGNFYKVDLPDEKIARMLDWDKPLHRQSPSVRKAVRSVVEEQAGPGSYAPWLRANRPDFRSLSENMLENLTEPQIAELLRARGVSGVRYFDGGSRDAASGTSNFVLFPREENALKILERNGKPIR